MQLGIDGNRTTLSSVPSAPKGVALEETYDATISSSTSITLNTSATFIEVSAIDKGIFLKWGGTASSTDFDGFIPQNTSKVFPIPVSQTTVEFIEEAATAKLVVVEYA